MSLRPCRPSFSSTARFPCSKQRPSTTRRRHLAIEGLQTIIRHMGAHFQMEFSALLAFSSSVEPLVSWTRDYTSIESRLAVPIAMGDRTDVARAIQFAIDYVVAEWGTVSPPCQIVVVADSPSIDAATADFAIPFPCKLHVLLLASPDEVESIDKTSARLCNPLGSLFIHCPNGALSFQSSSDMFRRLVDAHFVPANCVAARSNQKSANFRVLRPPPPPPPCMSRHLVLEIKVNEKSLEASVTVESGRKSNPSSATERTDSELNRRDQTAAV